MRKYFWPILVITLALLVAGTWVFFPEAITSVRSAVSSCAAAARDGWARLWVKSGESAPEVPSADWGDDDSNLLELVELRPAEIAGKNSNEPEQPPAVTAELRSAENDPDPSILTPAQRRQKYKELVDAAKARRLEVMRAYLMKSAEGREALKVTRAYYAKLNEMKKLEEKYGPIDDRVAAVRVKMVPLKEKLKEANARYRAWKEAHPSDVVDPRNDKLYRDLITRSRAYLD